MFKILLLSAAGLIAFSANAQIVLENLYTDVQQIFTLMPIDSGEYKYIDVDQYNDQITIYNLDHSVFTVIAVPTLLSGSITFYVQYVTRRLFDCDSSQIEYLVQYQDPGTLTVHVSVYRQDGTLLFDELDYQLPGVAVSGGMYTLPITNTPLGAKMILRSATSSSLPLTYAKVYSLCGLVPLYNSPLESDNTYANIYPNPASNQITLEYRLPKNIHQADLLIQDLNGKVVKQYKVTDAFQNIIFETNKLPVGMYTYSIQTDNGLVPSGKFIKSE